MLHTNSRWYITTEYTYECYTRIVGDITTKYTYEC
jgi:hypothetical protein